MGFTNGKKYMDVITYSGTGSVQSIGGLEFSPDFVWIKARNAPVSYLLVDSVRDPIYYLSSDSTLPETESAANVSSFTIDGFSLGNDATSNGSGRNFVAWCWKAGNETVTNTDGTISAQVRANQDAGFSVVKYVGDGGNDGKLVGHGLGKTPEFIIVKSTSTTTGWNVFHKSLSAQLLYLNDSSAAQNSSAFGTPDALTFLAGDTWMNATGEDYIAYCWSKTSTQTFGSYAGNGGSNFIYTGFKPRWIMIKCSSNSADWTIYDTERDSGVLKTYLEPNNADVESNAGSDGVSDGVRVVSNGFQIFGDFANINNSGYTYVYAVFGEESFATDSAEEELTLASSKDFVNLFVGSEVQQGDKTGTITAKDPASNTITVDSTGFQTGSAVTSTVDGTGEVVSVNPSLNRMTLKNVTGGFASGVGKNVDGTIRRLPKYQSETAVLTGVSNADPDYLIGNSLRFDSGNQSNLTRTNSVAGNRRKWTYSFWTKLSNSNTTFYQSFLLSGSGNMRINNPAASKTFYASLGSSSTFTSDRSFDDSSDWMHFVMVWDSDNSTESNRFKVYVDGEQITGTLSCPQGTDSYYNTADFVNIGYYNTNTALDAYMADVNFIDGQALSATDFGEYNPFGQWIAKEYTGDYGTNGFHLDFSNPNSLGEDTSGGDNDFTPNNLVGNFLPSDEETSIIIGKSDALLSGFAPALYTGNGGTQSITGLGFTPDLVWIKDRSVAYQHILVDSIRGANKYLSSNTTQQETNDTSSVTSIDSDGFSIGGSSAVNRSGDDYVAWCWDAGDTTFTNNDGALTAQVRSNGTFSVVEFDNPAYGDPGFMSWGHGLDTAPGLIIWRPTDLTNEWYVYHTSTGGGMTYLTGTAGTIYRTGNSNLETGNYFEVVNSTIVQADQLWIGPTSTKIIAYHWAESPAHNFGSYTGNGGSQTINCGFEPAFVMIKITSGAIGPWVMVDNTRGSDRLLYSDTDAIEDTNSSRISQFTTNGFVLGAASDTNGSGNVYMYMAFDATRTAEVLELTDTTDLSDFLIGQPVTQDSAGNPETSAITNVDDTNVPIYDWSSLLWADQAGTDNSQPADRSHFANPTYMDYTGGYSPSYLGAYSSGWWFVASAEQPVYVPTGGVYIEGRNRNNSGETMGYTAYYADGTNETLSEYVGGFGAFGFYIGTAKVGVGLTSINFTNDQNGIYTLNVALFPGGPAYRMNNNSGGTELTLTDDTNLANFAVGDAIQGGGTLNTTVTATAWQGSQSATTVAQVISVGGNIDTNYSGSYIWSTLEFDPPIQGNEFKFSVEAGCTVRNDSNNQLATSSGGGYLLVPSDGTGSLSSVSFSVSGGQGQVTGPYVDGVLTTNAVEVDQLNATASYNIPVDAAVIAIDESTLSITTAGGTWNVGETVSTTVTPQLPTGKVLSVDTSLNTMTLSDSTGTWMITESGYETDKKLNKYVVTSHDMTADSDNLLDSPTDYGTDTGLGGEVRSNYCTFNPLATQTNGTITWSDGNLKATVGGTRTTTFGTIPLTGKMYFEVVYNSGSYVVGMASSDMFATTANVSPNRFTGDNATSWGLGNDGSVYNGGSVMGSESGYSDGDVIGWAYDSTTGGISMFVNGVANGTYTADSSIEYFPAVSLTTSGSNAVINCGQRPFAYPAPAGYEVISTINI